MLAFPVSLVGFLVFVLGFSFFQALLSSPLVFGCWFPVAVFFAASWLNHRFYPFPCCAVTSNGSRSGPCFSSPPGSGHYASKPPGGASPFLRAVHWVGRFHAFFTFSLRPSDIKRPPHLCSFTSIVTFTNNGVTWGYPITHGRNPVLMTDPGPDPTPGNPSITEPTFYVSLPALYHAHELPWSPSQPQHASMRRIKKVLVQLLHLWFLSSLPIVCLVSCSLCVLFLALGSSCIITKRDSLLAGFTYPATSMSMPRRHSRTHGHPSSTAAPSDSHNPSRSVTDFTESTAWPSLRHAGSSDQTSHYGYSTAAPSTPLPAPADHQTPIPPRREEAYPLQMEMAETRRLLHAHYFTEVRTPQADNSQPELRRLMVTEVDRYGVHRNRQPEFFFNGIIGHIRADQNGWIDSWEQATQLANYWRRHFQIP